MSTLGWQVRQDELSLLSTSSLFIILCLPLPLGVSRREGDAKRKDDMCQDERRGLNGFDPVKDTNFKYACFKSFASLTILSLRASGCAP